MAKLISILAASFGGGLVLGAGIRLGEAAAQRRRTAPARNSEGFPGKNPAGEEPTGEELSTRISRQMDEQATEVAAIRAKLAAESRQVEALGEMGDRLRREIPDWIEKSVARRFEEAEAGLRAEASRTRQETLDSFVDGVQMRIGQRISRLEEEVSMHSSAMTELRACSLRTEAGIEKLAGSLERFLAVQTGLRAVPEPPAEMPEDRPARSSRRWGLFS